MDRRLERVELSLDKNKLAKLRQATVLVIGVGGVGSFAAEALARSGIGRLVLVDKDKVDITNLNRQLHADKNSVGKSKVLMMKERIESYAECEVICIEEFYDKNLNYIFNGVDFVIDAIDTITSKVDIMQYCLRNKIKFISSMGMANRFDPSKIEVSRLDKTYNDPLARACREMLKKRQIYGKIKVVFSTEIPVKQNKLINKDGKTLKERIPPSSMIFVPGACGLMCASEAIKEIIGGYQK